MPIRNKASDHPIPGEVWKPAPNGLIFVSDQGRAMTMLRNLISPGWTKGHVIWIYKVGRKSYNVKASSLVAEMFCGGNPSDPVRHRNGDLRDLRAVNLEIPWGKDQDELILDAVNIAQAATALGKTHKAVRRRAAVLGKVWEGQWTYTHGVPLEDRLEATKAAIAILERAGVADRGINLALGIPKPGRGPEVSAAVETCLKILYPRLTPAEIADAFGWRRAQSVRDRLRAMGLIGPSRYQGETRQGHPDPIDGEEWRRHACGVWVSSLGRVATAKGLISIQVRPNRAPFVHIHNDHWNTLVSTARLMLSVFRPDLPYSKKIFLNGDFQDVRLANIVGSIDLADAEREIRRRIRGNFTDQDRDEIVQAGVLALLDGRAVTHADAVRIGLAELHDIAGTYRNRSLDADVAGTEGLTMMDMITSDGEFYRV